MSYFKGIGKKSRSFGGRKIPLIGLIENKKYTIFNEYVPGSGVGASSVASRRLKKQRAYNKQCVPSTPPIKIVEDNGYIDFADDDVNINNDLIQQTIIQYPTANINLNSDTNVGTDFNVVLAVAESMRDEKLTDEDELITEKVFFSDYNIIDATDKNNNSLVDVLKLAGFKVTLSDDALTGDDTSAEQPDNDYIISLEIVSSDSLKIVLTENDDFEP